jgi:nitrite reductase (NADH) large subunit
MEKLIIIGNGMAAGKFMEELLALSNRFTITVYGSEPRTNYNRIMLSPVLSGEKTYEDIITHDDAWYEARNITLKKGVTITRIDREAKRVYAGDISEPYDRLAIVTGSSPFILPIEGKNLKGVVTYRDLDDVNFMLEAAKTKTHAVVIGGGLLGLEAAAGLKMQGLEVTVLHLMPSLMERQLDLSAGLLLEQDLVSRGITIHTRANTKAILGETEVTGVLLDNGDTLKADIVVMAAGIRPNSVLAKEAGLEVNRGVIVDDQMVTSDPDILSFGECVEHNGVAYGLVAPLYDMAKVAAYTLAGELKAFSPKAVPTRLKVTGVDLFSVGDFSDKKEYQEIVLRDASRNVYKRVIIADNKVVGAVLYGETAEGNFFFEKIKSAEDITDIRDRLIFGEAGVSSANPSSAVAALASDAEICGCNGVCKGVIVEAIEGGLTTLKDIRAVTKASASCGTCTGLVEQLLSLHSDYEKAEVEPLCGCTDLGHADVRRLISASHMKSIPAVMQSLNWKSSHGCAKCRPALNYYLICENPEEDVDDGRSRFINERVHANIQKNGTYSVVPRMWGGMTSAKELRAIADVADKFNIPAVKVTGGQRIDLLGIKKEDLPLVWSDLNKAGMISGAAYAKGLRTVKTCVGTDWCRFGTQDSTGLGIKLEKFLWGSWTPAKLKLAVSGCPRNCAEATCKDIGVICVDSGYEIHIGGAAGLHIKGTELLLKVASEDEAIEVIAAITQANREQGFYLERIYKWMARVGLDNIRSQISDLDNRKKLYDRFVLSQKLAQIDPWQQRVEGKDAHEFKALEVA